MSLALARTYRPKRFADVAVQSHVSTTLKGAIARGRVAHGYLLCGPRGVGKTTLARVLAMALNCERRGDAVLDGEPCGECVSCRRIWSGSASLDVVEIDAASNRGVDDARDLRERAMYAPSGDDSYKVYIVDEAHMLTREAWNALLKILEEPPPRVVFVFATTEPQKIAQAAAPVLSRLQRFDFKRIGPAEIRDRLAHVLTEEKIDSEPEALAAIARAADGSMRDALSLADQVLSMGDGTVTADRVRDALGLVPEDEFIAMLDIIADHRAADVFPAVAALAEAGVDFGGFLTGLSDMLRSLLAVVLGGVATELSERGREALVARKPRFAAADLLRMLQALGELEPRFKKSGQQQMLVETLLVRFALLDHAVDLEDVLRSMGGGEPPTPPASSRRGEVSGGASTSAPPRTFSGASASDESRSARAELGRRNEAQIPSRPVPQSASRSASPLAVSAASVAVAAPKLAPDSGSDRISAVPKRAALLEINKLTEEWDALVDKIKAGGKPMLATALEHASPVAVAASGVVTIALDEPNDIYAHAITAARAEIVSVLAERFSGVERVELRRDERGSTPTPPKRLTDEMVRAERIAALRKRDPVLRAAIDALDLDVVD
jgi:DNA polymerase III subunit gamma/tau